MGKVTNLPRKDATPPTKRQRSYALLCGRTNGEIDFGVSRPPISPEIDDQEAFRMIVQGMPMDGMHVAVVVGGGLGGASQQ